MGHGIHLMDFLLWLMGGWQDVRSVMGTLERDIQVEDLSMGLVRFPNGAMGSIVNSVLSPHQESYLRLDFQKATIEMSGLYRYSNENWTINLADNVDDPETLELWNGQPDNYVSNHEVQMGEILDSMDKNVRPPVSGEEARRIIEFTASLYKSAWTGLVVTKGEITPDDQFYYSNDPKKELVK
jgi:predicted dehydrogenase